MIFDFPPIFNTHMYCLCLQSTTLPYIFDPVISVLVCCLFQLSFPPNTMKHIGILLVLFLVEAKS
ncbi:hypothetical protein HanXRQr2_Chr05g0204181 [Helianthus annuus]|uniref:Uncharacterized protein n=1 Tax=Helianthus annuus TaxID=4232 RepID=A0A9K3IYC0_HELAN|nr:hypothetical protein HanXRQr2_Chr05g0204181 [Helianthus annuus]